MYFPDYLEPYRRQGLALVQTGKVQKVSFSGPTYQIGIEQPGLELAWVFLQFDHTGFVKDVFCSCEHSSQKGACEHMAAAYIAIYGLKSEPLHMRFEKSFWHNLFFALHQECHDKDPNIRYTEGKYRISTVEGTPLLEIGANKDAEPLLQSLLEAHTEETEENSIKFSSLSEEELEDWRAGRPTTRLRYELSPLSEIAKCCMVRHEKNAQCPLVFEITGDSLPTSCRLDCCDFHYTIFLNERIWSNIIPTLSTVVSNLVSYCSDKQTISDVSYNETVGAFTIKREVDSTVIPSVQMTKGAISIGAWFYIPGKGFFSTELNTRKSERLETPEAISDFLTQYQELVRKFVQNYEVHDEIHALKYYLKIDQAKNLHCIAYVFEPNDFLKKTSRYFGDWAFIEGKGFFHIPRCKFAKPVLVIPKEEISFFILHHRLWLSNYPGFSVHVAKIEERVGFELDKNNMLRFYSLEEHAKAHNKSLDLGEWVYIEKDGFYLKDLKEKKSSLPLNVPISAHAISDFIRKHLDQLQIVPGFFLENCPIKEIGLKIVLKKRGLIEINPEYSWWDESEGKKASFFDEFVYIPKKGFYRLPPNLRPLHFMRSIRQQEEETWNSFFQDLLPRLKSEYKCNIDPRLEAAEKLALTVKPLGEDEAESANILAGWDIDLYWKGASKNVSIDELVQAWKRHERFVPTDVGVIDLEDERFHWLRSVKDKKNSAKKGGYRFTTQDLLRLQAYEPVVLDEEALQEHQSFRDFLERLLTMAPYTPPSYPDLRCDLRSYQKNGVEWLWYLYINKLSGLLCDDMGVGKTHQAMALMASVRNHLAKLNRSARFLVVCPTSLVYHWQDKIKQFLPEFNVKVYFGNQRTIDDYPGDYQVFLTTYGIWRNEGKKLKKFIFDVAFFDELQIAKNHVSQIHAALLNIQSTMKIGLTGTPIENQLRELKALFDLILPGYMPEDSDFREFFVRSIEKDDNPKRRGLLSRYVKPFVLRRRKVDVLKDLPEKTEEMCYAELVGEQKSLYRNVASHQAAPLIQQLRDEGSPIPYMHIFALLSSLKQICNHPAAYLKDVENYERYESGKWEAFIELLEEARESQQKVVVFSQYLAMLDIFEAYLNKNSIKFASIRGQTRNRGEEIERFHKEADCEVFLGSLQAAGLGIDLTPASVVIHYDRWWNAARENQATDRVHRLGQVRGVQVFKLITKSTIEEKIDLMITKKSGLLEDVVTFDDHQVVKRLSRQEIISLLEDLGQGE